MKRITITIDTHHPTYDLGNIDRLMHDAARVNVEITEVGGTATAPDERYLAMAAATLLHPTAAMAHMPRAAGVSQDARNLERARLDPRVVLTPYNRIDVEKTLAKLGLSEAQVLAGGYPRGSTEDAVRRAIRTGSRSHAPLRETSLERLTRLQREYPAIVAEEVRSGNGKAVFHRINVTKTLENIGLSMFDLMNKQWPVGSLESRVRMSVKMQMNKARREEEADRQPFSELEGEDELATESN